MTGFVLSRLAMAAAVAMILGAQAMAQSFDSVSPKRLIVVSLEDRKLALLEDGQVKKVYPVSVGKASTPSPSGTFTIERRVANPSYTHDGKVVPPGPGNPVGTRWMGLSIRGYGIHGTNQPRSIGKAASHGCIRLAKTDLEELYREMHVGDTVVLIGQRNAQTARLFGAPQPMLAAPQQPLLTAQSQPAPAANQVAETDAASKALAVVAAGGTR
ncbi:MAG TPA: L,D-transpeptidase [Terracidiphilus sp.]|nr:L,D-transpeptidase [Terracidiphilus sp.]